MIGITVLLYVAKVIGAPNRVTGLPAATNAAQLGCKSTPAIAIDKNLFVLKCSAALTASIIGRK